MRGNGRVREQAGRIGYSESERLVMKPTGDADTTVAPLYAS